MLNYEGRVVVITGAGNGIGKSHALTFAQRGATVLINDINQEAADSAVAEIIAAGGKAAANYNSVVDGADNIIGQAVTTFGKIDVLVNNAGVGATNAPVSELSDGDWQRLHDIHLTGTFRCSRAAMREMQKNNYGRILGTASPVGYFAAPNSSSYATAKAATYSLMQCLSLEGKAFNIYANAVGPVSESEMSKPIFQDWWLELAKPSYVSEFVAWLAHESCGETGSAYEVGGGFIHQVRFAMSRGLALTDGAYSAETIARRASELADFGQCLFPDVGQMDVVVNEIATKSDQYQEGQSVYK